MEKLCEVCGKAPAFAPLGNPVRCRRCHADKLLAELAAIEQQVRKTL